MQIKKYRITPQSPWITPLRSDTLNGLILCSELEWNGEQACKKLIRAFTEEAPFICSSAMPSDFVFMPKLPGISRKEFSEVYAEKLIDNLHEFKKFRKQAYLPLSVWQKYCKKLSSKTLFQEWLSGSKKESEDKSVETTKKSTQMHNTVNRLTNTVDSGLFAQNSTFFKKNFSYDLYIQALDHKWILERLQSIGELGFGADSNLGKGQFRVSVEQFDTSIFEFHLDHKMSLSVLSSNKMQDIQGYYKLFTKKGRVGALLNSTTPYKKPFLALEEGAVLINTPDAKSCVLNDIHVNNEVIQICTSLYLPCSFSNEDKL